MYFLEYVSESMYEAMSVRVSISAFNKQINPGVSSPHFCYDTLCLYNRISSVYVREQGV